MASNINPTISHNQIYPQVNEEKPNESETATKIDNLNFESQLQDFNKIMTEFQADAKKFQSQVRDLQADLEVLESYIKKEK